jgi:hypothetical protein
MSVDVMSILRERKLTSLKRSYGQSERHDREVQQRAVRATAVINGTNPHAGKEHYNEYMLRDIYNRELENYTRQRVFTPEMNARALSLWGRVVKAWKASGVDMDTFVKAQFTYFHNVFRTHPTPVQLTTDGAVVRAASVAPEKVMTNNIPANVDLGELFKRCEKQMTEIMRAQKLTREEVYRKLVLTRMVAFPAQYLNADPVWRKVRDDG